MSKLRLREGKLSRPGHLYNIYNKYQSLDLRAHAPTPAHSPLVQNPCLSQGAQIHLHPGGCPPNSQSWHVFFNTLTLLQNNLAKKGTSGRWPTSLDLGQLWLSHSSRFNQPSHLSNEIMPSFVLQSSPGLLRKASKCTLVSLLKS